MFQRCDVSYVPRAVRRRCSGALAVWFLCSGIAAAQGTPSTPSIPTPSIPATGTSLRLVFPPVPGVNENDALPAPAGVRRITLQQAQQLAAAATNPLVRLGQLQVEAAEQHRLGVKSNYFPNISTQLYGLHFDSTPGDPLVVQRPFAGTTLSVPVNTIEQNQFAVNVVAIQPITPLFAIRQLVKISRADENIARAKAGMPVAEQASLVEKNYFDLLIAERELISAGAEARLVQATWVAVNDSTAGRGVTDQQTNAFGAARSLLLAASSVKALTASLNEMLGLPADTRLELVPPDPLVENVSLKDATAGATAGSVEIIEAEQTAVKAHAGSKLAKMEYFPTVAVMGGYTHQDAINAVLQEDFTYIGVTATYTLFNSFKRERGLREARAQAEAADLGVQLTKAKVAGAVKTSYLELERSRQLYQLARRMVSAPRVVAVSHVSGIQEADPAQAKLEAELFRADLEYRQAYAKVRSLIGNQ